MIASAHAVQSGFASSRGSLAIPEGLEPPTNSLEGCCSIQLSYGTRADGPI